MTEANEAVRPRSREMMMTEANEAVRPRSRVVMMMTMPKSLAFVLLAACGGSSATQHPQLPEDKPVAAPPTTVPWSELDGPVKTISVASDDQTQVAAIKQLLADLVGKPLDRQKLRSELANIVGSKGVADAAIDATQLADGIEIVITVRPQPALHALTAHEAGGADIPLPGALASATGLPLDPQLLEKVVYELRDGYLAKGYTDVAVAYQQTEAAPKQVDIAITVTPGKASTVTAVAFKGNKKVAAAALDKTAAIAKGSPYSDDAIDRAMLALQTYYYDHGFVNVIIMPPKPAGGPGPATFEITEGDQFRVGAVTLTGIDDAKKYLAMLPLKKGDVFSRAAIQTGIEKIQTALQKRVEPVTHVDAAKHTIDLDLQVPKT